MSLDQCFWSISRLRKFAGIAFVLLVLNSCLSESNEYAKMVVAELQSDDIIWVDLQRSASAKEHLEVLNNSPDNRHFNLILNNYLKLNRATANKGISSCRNDCATILINEQNKILFESEIIELHFIRQHVLDFMYNASTKEVYSSCNDSLIRTLSQAKFNLVFNIDSADILQDMSIEIQKAVHDYKRQLCTEWYGKLYYEAGACRTNFLDSLLTLRCNYEDFSSHQGPSPPTIRY